MVPVARIAKVVHPIEVVIHGVIDAVWTVELQGDDGTTQEVEEDGVVGSAADASVDDVGIVDRLGIVILLAFSGGRFQPGIVKRPAAGVLD